MALFTLATHVNGYLSSKPTLTPDALTARLTASAIPLGAPLPNNTFGFGRADAFTLFGPIPPILGDYDGDGRTDIAALDHMSATWYLVYSSTNQLHTVPFGWAALVPVPGDFDSEDRPDITVREPGSSTW